LLITQNHGYEYKEIHLEEIRQIKNIKTFEKKVRRNKSKFETVDELIQMFCPREQQIATEIFEYVYNLEGVYYYLSDGIMFRREFRRESRRFKFLSISTKGNRVLFHVPIKLRDSVFERFRVR
jgi:hypothetical protein